MPVTRIFPTKPSPQFKRIAATGASEITAITDSSDSTYIRRKASGSPLARYVLQTPSVPAANDVATIAPGGRLKQDTSDPPEIVRLSVAVGGTAVRWIRAGEGGATVYDFRAEPATTSDKAPKSATWRKSLKTLALLVDDGHSKTDPGRGVLYRLFADVYHLAPISISLAAIPSTVTESCPTLTFSVSAIVEDWQDNEGTPTRTECIYNFRIFTAQQVTASGFSPTSTKPVWEAMPGEEEERVGSSPITSPMDYIDGSATSVEATEVTVSKPLVNGSYYVYARARRIMYGSSWTSWASKAVTINAAPPSAPTVTCSSPDHGGYFTVDVTPAVDTGLGDEPLVILQRSTDSQVTWQDVPGAVEVPAEWGVPITFIDYYCPRGAAVYYRANVSLVSATGKRIVGPWRVLSSGVSLPKDRWHIKAVGDVSASLFGASVLAEDSYTMEEDSAIFRPIGRRDPVVVSMSLGGADSSVTAYLSTEEEIAAGERLREHRGPVVLESAYGWSRVIRITERSWVESGPSSAPRILLTLGYIEIGAEI